jgi:DNA polymerase I-like protein with 3'-5' exonuclease and polymerase domains
MTLPWYLDVSGQPWSRYSDGLVPVLTVDLETTNLDKGDPLNPDNRLVKIGVKLNDQPVISNAGDAFDILEELEGKAVVFVAHHAKFELAWLNREGFNTSQWLPWDTMIAEFVISGNRGWELGLGAVAQRYGLGSKGRAVDRMMKAGVCPSQMPAAWVKERVEWDVEKTYALFLKQRATVFREGLERVLFTRCILTPVLAHVESYGMTLDADRVREEHDRLVKRRIELLGELNVIAKGRKLKGPQLAKLVYEDLKFKELTNYRGEPIRTDTGQPSTAADTLMALKASTPEQKRFLELFKEYNSVDSAISKYLAFYLGVVNERGGRFFANFSQTVVRTHRLSSSGKPIRFADGKKRSVQFHNQPKVYKRLFRARPGYHISAADGSQLEFRVAGSLAHDAQVLNDVVTGADIHRYTASEIFDVEEHEVTKSQRDKAKSRTFKPLYGGNRGTKREMEYYEAFRKKYRTMFNTQMGWVHTVLKEKVLRIASGLKFYWPDTRMQNSGYITNTPSIFDYPVQSLATADIIPVGLVYTFWTVLAQGLDCKLINTVHDSIEAEVKEADIDKYHEVVVQCMLDRTYEYLEAVYGLTLYVPLGVAYKSGTHWGDGDETSISYPDKRTP